MKMRIRVGFWLGVRRLRRYMTRAPALRLRGRIPELVKRVSRESMEQELFASCLILRNLAIIQKDKPLSLDHMLEELMDASDALRSVYEDVLFRWRSGQGNQSFSAFEERIGTKTAEHFAFLLSGMDRINPAEMITALDTFEETYSGERITAAMRRASRKSFLITAFATASVFAVLMNFAVVVVFMDMMRILGGMGTS